MSEATAPPTEPPSLPFLARLWLNPLGTVYEAFGDGLYFCKGFASEQYGDTTLDSCHWQKWVSSRHSWRNRATWGSNTVFGVRGPNLCLLRFNSYQTGCNLESVTFLKCRRIKSRAANPSISPRAFFLPFSFLNGSVCLPKLQFLFLLWPFKNCGPSFERVLSDSKPVTWSWNILIKFVTFL